jgi:2-amino-4-hydroxy-6-hydroxymethyldihydropteridine diphosphokinase
MPRYIIALGSSHHFGPDYISRCLDIIKTYNNFSYFAASKIIINSAQETNFNRLFYNCAVAISSNFQPKVFYRELKTIEHNLGRIRAYYNSPRTIDIDIIFSPDICYTSFNFFIPHLAYLNRNFFVAPAIEALELAGWPAPTVLLNARKKFGQMYVREHNA